MRVIQSLTFALLSLILHMVNCFSYAKLAIFITMHKDLPEPQEFDRFRSPHKKNGSKE